MLIDLISLEELEYSWYSGYWKKREARPAEPEADSEPEAHAGPEAPARPDSPTGTR